MLYAMDRYTVSENEDLVSLCVERDGDTSEALSVQLATRTLNPVDAIGENIACNNLKSGQVWR